MKIINHRIYQISVAVILFVLILDAKTAISGAAEAADLCVKTLIPSLFPFIFFSGLFRNIWQKTTNPLLIRIGKLCKLPRGGENLFLLGLIGGYPVGAKCVYDSYCDKNIDHNSANRMLCFCNNAGPSFIIGIVGFLFEYKYVAFWIWGIQILSAIFTAAVIPACPSTNMKEIPITKTNLTMLLRNAISAIANICGWVIVFRVILVTMNKWILWMLPNYLQIVIAGVLELTNGILMLSTVSSLYLRFLLANLFLSLGGLCIALQTKSVAPGFDYKNYYKGKLLQASLCLILSSIIGAGLFPGNNFTYCIYGIIIGVIAACIIHHFIKKNWKKTDIYCIMNKM